MYYYEYPNYNESYHYAYQQEEIKSRRELLRDMLKEWSETSTSHGLPRIIASKSIIIKIMWLIFLLLSLSIGCFVIVQNIKEFYEHQVVTKIRYENERPIKFPTITICKINPYGTKDGNLFIFEFELSKYYNYINDLNITDDSAKVNYEFNLINQYVSDPSFDSEKRNKFSLNINEMIVVCLFNNVNCNFDEFETIYYPKYGVCFKFNSGFNINKTKTEVKKSFNIGDKNGLILELYSGDVENLIGYTKNEGFRVFINDQSILPTQSEGLNIQNGKCTDIELNKIISQNQHDPYSECQHLKKYSSYLFDYLKKRPYDYRQKDCFDLCYQQYLNEKCNCFDTTYSILDKNLKPCYLSFNDYKCMLDKTNEFYQIENNENCLNQCPLECKTIKFDLKTSISDYPALYYYSFLYKKIKNESSVNLDEMENLKKTIACLNIFYNDFKYTQITEEPKMNTFDLISNIGGTLGLFIGISILSFIEILELILQILLISFNRYES